MTGYNKVFLDTTPLIYFLDNDDNFGDKTNDLFLLVFFISKPVLIKFIFLFIVFIFIFFE